MSAPRSSFLKRLQQVSLGSAMADMALLLLVFFMAATTTEPPKGVDVDLPAAVTRGAEQDSIYITIGRGGVLYLDGRKVTIEEMATEMSYRAGERDRPVALTADKGLDYRTVRQVLDLLQEREFLNIVFMSQPRKGGRS